ncbi:amino acid ABC transporter permease [Heyndrickxia sporothermodurans]|uniref:amino acid ABC transporter permease n=1 Tax=Heyndrickxia sporothermodurans TaxID=46224 RepID=UPI002DBE268C|nr:amino acid ABC transporter permease [Heyndrickxia sporothermodurans]MEB6550672.1 amino acid ABC transporter permease [Heyndrickxia sporothermodurans]MED3650756.1 amino acid ABC transporter permease [Heyndrickxia sporothermodurans]MED3655731.1 amino acid ABC transporter permease [Heyndrickxia sporothermodurans]MED3698336.1 amino acid ABC transporter permease [Heyndrickxia sporothermodurans]MED3780573.1 amino acid ABC transporter permease [Heyndrickxia sporothermodurans]
MFTDDTIRIIGILRDSFFPILKAGIYFTIPLSIITFILGTILAFVTALVRISEVRPLIFLAKFYLWIFRGTPLLVQLFILFYGLPKLGITLAPFPAAIIGFTLNVGAYSSEIFRASILSIPKGQWEAAFSIGMKKSQAMRRIILPQAMRVSLPPLGNSFISLVKDTSLAATITVTEMFQKSQQIVAATYEPLWLYIEVAFIYLLFSTVLSFGQSMLERRYNRTVAK